MLTAIKAIKDIIGDKMMFFGEANGSSYAVCTPLLRAFNDGMFAPCDPKFGVMGIIGIPRPMSQLGKDIAPAVHESFHAWLHIIGDDWQNEQLVNMHSENWIRSKMSGIARLAAIESIIESKLSYNHN